ncbi:MAG: thioredoxin family protein [Ferruginibacter sp.]|nr:thioredoxin family protein [Ferruginibacter sp.]
MKLFAFILLTCFFLPGAGWLTNFEEASKTANDKHRLILLNFSGSDWCGPCIRLKNEIFQTKMFEDFATTNLVLVNADFPRSNKNKLSKEQVKQNEALADKYNTKGRFPLTLLIDADGKVLKEWDGLPSSATQFIQQLKEVWDARH